MFFVNLLLAYVWLVPLTLVHELGHALVGRITGFKVFWISIGYGRQLFDNRILGFNLRINLFPFGGSTALASRTSSWLRTRLWFSTFAGPATHLTLLGICLFVFRGALSVDLSKNLAPVKTLIYANALLLLTSVVLKRAGGPAGLSFCDGYQLLRIPFLKDEEMEEYTFVHFGLEAQQHVRSGETEQAILIYEDALKVNPQSYALRHDLAVARLTQGDYKHSREEFLKLLESKQGSQTEHRIMLLNNIAWADVVLGTHELLPEADSFSEEAMRLAPKVTSVKGTRGAVLVRTGRTQEGLSLLRTAFRQHSDQSARASVAYWIAIGAALSGNLSESIDWLRKGRQECPGHYLQEMAEQEVKAAFPVDGPLVGPPGKAFET